MKAEELSKRFVETALALNRMYLFLSKRIGASKLSLLENKKLSVSFVFSSFLRVLSDVPSWRSAKRLLLPRQHGACITNGSSTSKCGMSTARRNAVKRRSVDDGKKNKDVSRKKSVDKKKRNVARKRRRDGRRRKRVERPRKQEKWRNGKEKNSKNGQVFGVFIVFFFVVFVVVHFVALLCCQSSTPWLAWSMVAKLSAALQVSVHEALRLLYQVSRTGELEWWADFKLGCLLS